jgi:hypothetical protein
MAFVFVSLQVATFASIEPRDMARASALFQAQRQSAGAIGVAIGATVLTSQHVTASSSPIGAFRPALLAVAGLSAIGALVAAVAIRDADAAPTMHHAIQAAHADEAAAVATGEPVVVAVT